jgi:hypothetical protein
MVVGYYKWLISIACALCSLSLMTCGGGSQRIDNHNQQEYAEAGVVAGIAVTAAIIQSARSQSKPVKSAKECCAICDRCSFPCGNSCVSIGSICFKPKGCACYDSQLPISERPPRSDHPCLNESPEGNHDEVIVPMGVEY